jgi:dTDP-4-dehydrorhamnose reductase
MKILVLGSAGQLAHDLLKVFGNEALGLSHSELDVTDEGKVSATLQCLKPTWVLNTAAFHRVDDCEVSAALAFGVNAIGALNVSRAAAAIDAGVVFFSTDYVFDGIGRRLGNPYLEKDIPRPLNVYGVSKLAGENLVRQSNRKHLVIRTTGLYGSVTSGKGWTFPELMLRKGKAEGIVRVVDDQILVPTYTADLAQKTKELIGRDCTGLYHLTNGGECSWFQFTTELFGYAHLDAVVEPITSAQIRRRAKRPCYSALASDRLGADGLAAMRPWREALQDYLQESFSQSV